MKHARISFFTLLGFAACSGYDGGGDVLVTGGVLDAGGNTTDGGGTTPTVDSGQPRLDGGSTDARTDGPATTHPSGVVAYYPFDGDGTDQSPALLRLHLSVTNASFQPGRVGTSLYLTASGPGATRPQVDDVFTFASRDFTVQAWMAANMSVGTKVSASTGGWALFVTQSSAGFLTDGLQPLSASLPATNAFRHVVVRRASGQTSLFVNGTNVGNLSSAGSISAGGPLTIQRVTNDVSGQIDEVAIWSRALSETEISAQYNRGQSGQPATFGN